MAPIFLTAEWRKLAMANYPVEPDRLRPFLPPRTELDTWAGDPYVSLVGFQFREVRVKGRRIPFHTHFPEVNLRFYVRYKDGSGWKRGVVFVREIVLPRGRGGQYPLSGTRSAQYAYVLARDCPSTCLSLVLQEPLEQHLAESRQPVPALAGRQPGRIYYRTFLGVCESRCRLNQRISGSPSPMGGLS